MSLIAEAKTRVSKRLVEMLDDAIVRWGEGVVEEMLRRPSALATCYACGRHTGFSCTCGRGEKWEATLGEVKRQFGPPAWLLSGKKGEDMKEKAAAYMRRDVPVRGGMSPSFVPVVVAIVPVWPEGLRKAVCGVCFERVRETGRRECSGCRKRRQRGG